MDTNDYFKGKRVVVMRIGLLGRGIGDAAYLAEAGASVLVVDSASSTVMQPAVAALADYPTITFKFGAYDFNDFKDADLVLVGAGAPIDEPVLVECRNAGIPLAQSAALFAKLSGVPIIGVTGTRGKSTVTHMIHYVLSMVTGEEVLLGGNIRGVSNLQLLKKVHADSLCVMELDSWQLQGWGWSKRSPHIAVFTNFMEDHMNYYRGDMDAYFADKANIFRYQEESGTLITTTEIFTRAQSLSAKEGVTLGQEVVLVDASLLPEDLLLSVPGDHNRLNAALALAALRAVGLTDDEILDALVTFPGVPGRLEFVGSTEDGVKIYNDNNATTPAATVVGVTAVAAGRNVILIAGGSYKNIDPAPLLPLCEEFVKQLIIVPGTGSDTLVALLERENSTINRTKVESLEAAVIAALAAAGSGDVILFSPAFASFGLFKNEYERNDEFMRVVRPLIY